jgi:hypothetical protein
LIRQKITIGKETRYEGEVYLQGDAAGTAEMAALHDLEGGQNLKTY